MSDRLASERCTACRRDSPAVTAEDMAELRPLVPQWELDEIDGAPRLERGFRFKSYRAALAFTQRVGNLAEAEDHHPVIVTEFRRVRVTWWTTAIRALHRNDFIMAAKTDALFAESEPRVR
jgi:4a-hydroxytetrahydrobiopterin dehydratase